MPSRVQPPLASGWPLIGSLLPIMTDPLPFLVKSYMRHGPVFRVRAAHRVLTVIAGPEANVFFMRGPGARLLGSHQAFKRMVDDLGTNNLVIGMDGQRHQYVRRLLRPAYSREMMDRSMRSEERRVGKECR